MRKGWEVKKLGDLCQIDLGKTPYRGDKSFWDVEKDTDNVWLSIADLLKTDGDVVSDSKEYITDKAAKMSKVVSRGTLLLSFKLTLGRLAFAGRDLFTNEAIAALTIKNEKEIDKYFLYQFLSLFDWDAASEGDVKVKGKTLNKAKLKEIEVHYPKSLPEQQRIVSILDEAFAAIATAKANAEQNLKNAKELFESYLQGVFENKGEGWEEKTLGEVCEYEKSQNNRSDLPYVGLEDIQANTGIFVGPDTPRSMKSLTFYFNTEHVLYGRLRPYLNKVLIPDFEGHCSTEIFPIKPKKYVIDRSYLFHWLIANETMKKINATWTGATLPRANMNAVLDFKINIPPIKEQRKIVEKLDALSTETKRLDSIYQQKITDLEELKKTILQKAFNGELSSPNGA
jgi:type I restriction enzyme S subunit